MIPRDRIKLIHSFHLFHLVHMDRISTQFKAIKDIHSALQQLQVDSQIPRMAMVLGFPMCLFNIVLL